MPDSYVFTGKDGTTRTFVGDRPPTADEMTSLEAKDAPPAAPETSGGPTAALGALQLMPIAGKAAARFAADHPAATQKIIGAGISTAAGGVGGAVGGVPGAVVGASIRGVTPAQTTIRQTAGQLAGESPALASDAAKALAIQNYAKETNGLKLRPTDIIAKPNPSNALESYANSMERGILRLYGPNGEVVSGPSAVSRIPTAAAPSVGRQVLQRIGNVLTPLSIGAGVTDVAQAVEPKRHDIGVMGIGASTPHDEQHPALLNLLYQKAMLARQRLLDSLSGQ